MVASGKKKQKMKISVKIRLKGDYSRARPLCFANQWIVQDIPSLSSQSERAKNTIHWFGIY